MLWFSSSSSELCVAGSESCGDGIFFQEVLVLNPFSEHLIAAHVCISHTYIDCNAKTGLSEEVPIWSYHLSFVSCDLLSSFLTCNPSLP